MINRTKISSMFVRIFSLLLCVTIFLTACSNNGKSSDKNSKDSSQSAGEKTDGSQDNSKELSDAANEACDCISDLESSLSSDMKAMIIKAGNSSNPSAVLEDEINKVSDSTEQQKLKTEFDDLENSNVVSCIENVRKSHPNVSGAARKGQKKLSTVVEENCSEFAAALLKLGKTN